MNILSLFDGISCGMIALERAGINVQEYFASEIDKYAIQISNKNYPLIQQLGDIVQVKAKQLPKIDLLIGGSPCFVKGTKVITKNEYKNIEDVVVGDEVITHTGKFQKVIRVGSKNSDTIIIKAQGIKPTETTEEHPFFVRTMERKWDNKKRSYTRNFSDPYWKKAIDLNKNDFIGININNLLENPLNLTEEECYILGRYIADGHTKKDYRTSENRPNNRKWQLILSIGYNKLESFKKNISHNNYSCYEHTKSVYRVVFSNKRLVEIAEKYCGCGAINKIIPQMFINLPVGLLRKVLDGYMDGDGCCINNIYKATSISENLIMTLSQAIAKIYRVNSSYEHYERPKKCIIDGRVVNQHDSFSITFRKDIKKQSKAVVIGDIIWLPVKNVGAMNKNKLVYNLEVDVDNSYTANNCIVHNCQGFSFAGKQLNFEDPRSKLFFEYVRILRELKERNPNIKFLLENVKMKQEYQDVITKELGVRPIAINSSKVSAQNRARLYWTNIEGIEQPNDLGLVIKDILQSGVDDSYFMNQKQIEGVQRSNYRDRKPVTIDKKCPTLKVGGDKKRIILPDGGWRYLTEIECERLQTVPENYTEGVSSTQRYKSLGNGWTVDVIAHIFKQLNK